MKTVHVGEFNKIEESNPYYDYTFKWFDFALVQYLMRSCGRKLATGLPKGHDDFKTFQDCN